MILPDLAAVFVGSLAIAALVVLTAPWHRRWSADLAGSGIQKHHHGEPPRVGLLPILGGCLVGYAAFDPSDGVPSAQLFALLLLCALPAALSGLLEDVTKKVRARWRLIGPALGAAAGMALLGTTIPSLGIPALDGVLAWWPLAAALTLLMVVGFTQAMNIVDGLNGLASGLAVLMLGATAWAAHLAGDVFVMQASLTVCAAVLGFMALNFPRGLMFLGDGGAYFLGFVLAQLWILLLVRNPGEVSPWFVMAVAAHPTIETVFSIVRRRLLRHRTRNATAPDRLHLHTLIFRRRTRGLWSVQQRAARPWAMNALASASLLAATALPIALAALNPAGPLWNVTLLVASTAAFLWQFRRMTVYRSHPKPQAPRHTRAPSREAPARPAAESVRPAAVPRRSRPAHAAGSANGTVTAHVAERV